MKLIIEIPEKTYHMINAGFYDYGDMNVIIQNGTPLDKIRVEIEALPKTYPFINHIDTYVKEDDVKKIIDKYKAESEG